MAAADMLDREQKGELLEMIIDAVLNDGQPSSDNKCVNGVFKQFMAVIERKSSSYFGRRKHIDEVNEAKKKEEVPQVPTFVETTVTQPSIEQEIVYEPTYDNCLETLKQIMVDEGDYKMEAQANKYAKQYGYSVKEMCTTVRGH